MILSNEKGDISFRIRTGKTGTLDQSKEIESRLLNAMYKSYYVGTAESLDTKLPTPDDINKTDNALLGMIDIDVKMVSVNNNLEKTGIPSSETVFDVRILLSNMFNTLPENRASLTLPISRELEAIKSDMGFSNVEIEYKHEYNGTQNPIVKFAFRVKTRIDETLNHYRDQITSDQMARKIQSAIFGLNVIPANEVFLDSIKLSLGAAKPNSGSISSKLEDAYILSAHKDNINDRVNTGTIDPNDYMYRSFVNRQKGDSTRNNISKIESILFDKSFGGPRERSIAAVAAIGPGLDMSISNPSHPLHGKDMDQILKDFTNIAYTGMAGEGVSYIYEANLPLAISKMHSIKIEQESNIKLSVTDEYEPLAVDAPKLTR